MEDGTKELQEFSRWSWWLKVSHDENVEVSRVEALLEGYVMLLRLFADAIREVGSFRS